MCGQQDQRSRSDRGRQRTVRGLHSHSWDHHLLHQKGIPSRAIFLQILRLFPLRTRSQVSSRLVAPPAL